jgi:hypothetical protein
LFFPCRDKRIEPLDAFLIATEGEYNQLQLQSLSVRVSCSRGEKPNYLFACAAGGVQNADLDCIQKIARHPVVCYDNDSAGLGLVEKIRQVMSVSAFTSPSPGSDIDDYIRSFGDNHEGAWAAVRELVKARQFYERPYEAVASDIRQIRKGAGKGKERKRFEIDAAVARAVREDLSDRGKFYSDGRQGYFFFEGDKRLIALDVDSDDVTLLLSKYGINRSERLYRYIFEDLRVHALDKGERAWIHRLAYFDADSFTLYLGVSDNHVHRISSESVEVVDNGSDGVLFLSRQSCLPFEVRDIQPEESLIDEMIVSKINFAEDQLTVDERKIIFLRVNFKRCVKSKKVA